MMQLPRVRAESQENDERAFAREHEEPHAPPEPSGWDTVPPERIPGETIRAGNDLEARLDELQEAANTASAHARNVYLTFLLFGLYLAIIFGSTTHEQLLRESPVTLPLLDVGLPLVGFYWVAPTLFVLLHLNLLLELYLLSGRLHRLDSAIAELGDEHDGRAGNQRVYVYPFPFSQMLIGRQHGRLMRLLFWLIVWLTVLVLPVVLLLAGQVRFLPYHDAATTMWHRFLVAADLLLILIFWRVIRHPADRLLARPAHWFRHQAKVLAGALLMLVLSFLIITFPGDQNPDFGDPMEEWLLALAPESVIDRAAARLTSYLFEYRPFLGRNLTVPETNLVGSWPTQEEIDQHGEDLAWKNFGAPPSLDGRDLSHARLAQSILVRGDLREANLQDAFLEGANLQGAELGDAILQGATLRNANLQGANLQEANLQGALLWDANLQGANLQEANLQGADLWNANLQGANLQEANLQGARLQEANVRGADLAGANLQGADFTAANLQGADLRRAKLWQAELTVQRSAYHLADLRRLNLMPPAPSDLDQWIADAKEIANEFARKQVLTVLSRLRQELRLAKEENPSWKLNFPPGLAEREDVLFEPVPPPTFAEFDSKLAEFLAGLACAPDAPPGIAREIVARAINEKEPGRLYPGLVAKVLLSNDCPQLKEIEREVGLTSAGPESVGRVLSTLLRDHLVAGVQRVKRSAGSL